MWWTAYGGVDDVRAQCLDLLEDQIAIIEFGDYPEERFYDDIFRVTRYRIDPPLYERTTELGAGTIADSATGCPAARQSEACCGRWAEPVYAFSSRASWSRDSSSRRRAVSVSASPVSSRSHSAISSLTFATIQCCSARDGRATCIDSQAGQ